MKRIAVSVSSAGPLLFALVAPGCNAILGNEQGTLDGGTTTTAAPFDASVAPLTCSEDKKICVGQCVGRLDPLFGCAADPSSPSGCDACKPAHAKADCSAEGHLCDYEKCLVGYGDCNGKHADGCEADLSQQGQCGSCNTVCAAATPFCAPGGLNGFACAASCAAPLEECGSKTQCFDTTTAVRNCGSCGNDCRTKAPPHSAPGCAAGQCAFTCDGGWHRCDGQSAATCELDTDLARCGPTCTGCTLLHVKGPRCSAGSCDYEACEDGFADCDGDRTNGCESDPRTDVNNCGGCSTFTNRTACRCKLTGEPSCFQGMCLCAIVAG